MKIGVLGAGNIGGNLARRFAEHGHQIRFGMRDPDKAAPLVDACGPSASAGDVASAAAFGDVIVLAVPWGAVDNVLSAAGDLSGKVLIDATNALTWDDGPVPAVTPSGAEIIAERCKGARVVKAFNTIGAEHLLDPNKTGTQADMLFCGDDEAARASSLSWPPRSAFIQWTRDRCATRASWSTSPSSGSISPCGRGSAATSPSR